MNLRECKRCLLLESGEKAVFETVNAYLENLDESEKVSDEIYRERLNNCGECDSLISGMCLKCGCYVEIRAALKNKSCPNADNRRW